VAFGVLLFPLAHSFKSCLFKLLKFQSLDVVFIIELRHGLLIYRHILIVPFLAIVVRNLPRLDVHIVQRVSCLLQRGVQTKLASRSIGFPTIFNTCACMAVIIISTIFIKGKAKFIRIDFIPLTGTPKFILAVSRRD